MLRGVVSTFRVGWTSSTSTASTSPSSMIITRAYHGLNCYGSHAPPRAIYAAPEADVVANRTQHAALLRYVEAVRRDGHRRARIDPLGVTSHAHTIPHLRPELFGVQLGSSTARIPLAGLINIPGQSEATAEEIVDYAHRVYCGSIAAEFEHLSNPAEREWFARTMEGSRFTPLPVAQRRRIHKLMLEGELLDQFLAKKYVQLKRYGGEGAESMIPAVDELFRACSVDYRIPNVVLCMPHRGRSNLLTGLLQFPLESFFAKISGRSELPESALGTGDVMSHLYQSVQLPAYPAETAAAAALVEAGGIAASGASNPNSNSNSVPVYVSMLPNPSHLEAINPVAVGKCRAKLSDLWDQRRTARFGDDALCVQIHGDAAFAGQGIVPETFAMSTLPHYTVGGSVHLIVNNQIGFTTPPSRARSTEFSSDIAKGYDCPVLRVNGDDPEEVVRAMRLAIAYRQEFRKDALVDMYCYRLWGHNELDDPTMTQPKFYRSVRTHISPPLQYDQRLIAEGLFGQGESATAAVESLREQYREVLANSFRKATAEGYETPVTAMHLGGKWSGIRQAGADAPAHATVSSSSSNGGSAVSTGVDRSILESVAVQSVAIPESLAIHERVKKMHVDTRVKSVTAEGRADWGAAEAMAFGSLMARDGYNVRISGQDVGRATFAFRHSMLVDQETDDASWIPLNNLKDIAPVTSDVRQGHLEVCNSLLSEEAVLAFESGYSWESPRNLCIWEAQFGDFFNGAQIIVDTFLTSAEDKWLRQSALTLLLPHGYDGAGPEHSSARIERWLQMTNQHIASNTCVTPNHAKPTSSGSDIHSSPFYTHPEERINMQVVYPTTPAQYFHLLRRQMVRPYRLPLVVVVGKTLLRGVYSPMSEMEPGTQFQSVLPDPQQSSDDDAIDRVVFCSGKVYYDYHDAKKHGRPVDPRTTVVRLEELAPFPGDALRDVIQRYHNASEFVWFQEEPENMGAWSFVEPRFRSQLGIELQYVGRPAASAPAVGVSSVHKVEVQRLFEKILPN